MPTAILLETGASMDIGAPSKRLRAIREAHRLLGGGGAWTACKGLVRWFPGTVLPAALGGARHVDLPGAARRLARLGVVDRVVVLGDLYDPRSVLEAMRILRNVDREFVEVLTPVERGLAPADPSERALVAYLETLLPHRERALAELASQGVRLSARAQAA